MFVHEYMCCYMRAYVSETGCARTLFDAPASEFSLMHLDSLCQRGSESPLALASRDIFLCNPRCTHPQCNSGMRSEGFRFTSGVWGQGCVRQMSCLCAQPFATVRNRLQPPATVCVTVVRLSRVTSASGVVPKVCQLDS